MSKLAYIVLAICIFLVMQTGVVAYGHFSGATKNIDNYQVIFAPNTSTPKAGDNSTSLNFSILENNANIYNIYTAMVVTEKQSGDIVGQVPYKFQEFSDITIPYAFNDTGTYVITLQTRIAGDEKYQVNPLVASFDISVDNQLRLIPFDQLILFYVTPLTVATVGIVVYLQSKKKL